MMSIYQIARDNRDVAGFWLAFRKGAPHGLDDNDFHASDLTAFPTHDEAYLHADRARMSWKFQPFGLQLREAWYRNEMSMIRYCAPNTYNTELRRGTYPRANKVSGVWVLFHKGEQYGPHTQYADVMFFPSRALMEEYEKMRRREVGWNRVDWDTKFLPFGISMREEYSLSDMRDTAIVAPDYKWDVLKHYTW
jgi:hypothetical protein